MGVLPIKRDMYHWAFTPKEQFMINLCNVCDEANALLDLIDKVVAVIHDTQNNDLKMEKSCLVKRIYSQTLEQKNDIPLLLPDFVDVTIEFTSGKEQNHKCNLAKPFITSYGSDSG